MVDRSLLPPTDWEFVVLADTHHMLDVEAVEFESRRRQTARIDYAISVINALEPAFVVHLGDLVQEFPESGAFDRAMDAAQRQLGQLDAPCHYVPGNHDVGDKPDPTMPTQPVSSASLAAYHDRFGRSWERWSVGGIDFISVNSQLFNSTLSAADEQRSWLETELRTRVDHPTFLFVHLPPYLTRPDDPGLGHYDTIGQPDRDWFLDLVEAAPVTHVLAAHAHFEFRNRLGDTEFHVIPSPAFTRPGFSEVFSSCPPPERGRDDRPKLGFYLVRIRKGDPTFHFIRTGGATKSRLSGTAEPLLTLPSRSIGESRLGISIVQSFAPTTAVPAAFPTSTQHRIRDDYSLLACLEIGAAVLRLPIQDCQGSPPTRENLESFRRQGGTVVGTVLRSADERAPAQRIIEEDFDPASLAAVDGIELQIAGSVWPSEATVDLLGRLRTSPPRQIGLSVVVPGRSVSGKQHNRPRKDYRPVELERLDGRLDQLGGQVDRVVCRIGAHDDPWTVIREAPDPHSLDRIGAIDWVHSSIGTEERSLVDRLSRALLAVATTPDSRLFLEPLRSLDRTMDVATGLLDRRRNPTAAFHAARCLNTVLFGGGGSWQPLRERSRSGGRLLGVMSGQRTVVLALPAESDQPFSCELLTGFPARQPELRRRIDLSRGTSREAGDTARDVAVDSPTAFLFD